MSKRHLQHPNRSHRQELTARARSRIHIRLEPWLSVGNFKSSRRLAKRLSVSRRAHAAARKTWRESFVGAREENETVTVTVTYSLRRNLYVPLETTTGNIVYSLQYLWHGADRDKIAEHLESKDNAVVTSQAIVNVSFRCHSHQGQGAIDRILQKSAACSRLSPHGLIQQQELKEISKSCDFKRTE
jgi:hypothetical protein